VRTPVFSLAEILATRALSSALRVTRGKQGRIDSQTRQREKSGREVGSSWGCDSGVVSGRCNEDIAAAATLNVSGRPAIFLT